MPSPDEIEQHLRRFFEARRDDVAAVHLWLDTVEPPRGRTPAR